MIRTVNETVLVLALQEDLIAPNVRAFEPLMVDHMRALESVSIDELILDLTDCENIDSVGVTFIVGLYKAVIREGKNFRVTGSNSDIRQLFKLMKLDEFIDLEE